MEINRESCDPDDDDGWRDTSTYRAWKQRIKRAVRELIAAEAIVLVQAGRRGRNAIYAVTPDALLTLIVAGT